MAYGYVNGRGDVSCFMGERPWKAGTKRDEWDKQAVANPVMVCPLSGKECPGTRPNVTLCSHAADDVRVCAAASMLGGRCPIAAIVTLGARAAQACEDSGARK